MKFVRFCTMATLGALVLMLSIVVSVSSGEISEDSLAALIGSLSDKDFAKPFGKIVPPEWPASAPDTVFKATVLVRIHTDDGGSVDSVESIFCSDPDHCFIDEALTAARKTVFSRFDSTGNALPEWQYYTYSFWSPEVPKSDEFVEIEVPAEFTYRARPDYPRSAERAGIEGTVWVKCLVTHTGRVADVQVYKSSGNESLDRAAVVAAFKCKLKPATQGGKPVTIWLAWPYNFKL